MGKETPPPQPEKEFIPKPKIGLKSLDPGNPEPRSPFGDEIPPYFDPPPSEEPDMPI